MSASNAPSARRVATAQDASALIAEVGRALDALERTLARETELMGVGRIDEALTCSADKQEQAGVYMRLLESVKANAIALARFAPEAVEELKSRHGAFAATLAQNQRVIATVKSVSETLVRSLQQEAAASRVVSGYGPGATATKPAPAALGPLALSVRL